MKRELAAHDKAEKAKKIGLPQKMGAELGPDYLRALKHQSETNRKPDSGLPSTVDAGKVSHTNLSLLAYARFNSTTNALEISVIQHDAKLEAVDFLSPNAATDEFVQQEILNVMNMRLDPPARFTPVYQSFLNEMRTLVNPRHLISVPMVESKVGKMSKNEGKETHFKPY
jgi:hypothetical protein